jgi:hypothetical protein
MPHGSLASSLGRHLRSAERRIASPETLARLGGAGWSEQAVTELLSETAYGTLLGLPGTARICASLRRPMPLPERESDDRTALRLWMAELRGRRPKCTSTRAASLKSNSAQFQSFGSIWRRELHGGPHNAARLSAEADAFQPFPGSRRRQRSSALSQIRDLPLKSTLCLCWEGCFRCCYPKMAGLALAAREAARTVTRGAHPIAKPVSPDMRTHTMRNQFRRLSGRGRKRQKQVPAPSEFRQLR